MALPFTKPIERAVKLKAGNDAGEFEAVVEFSATGISFRKKGKQKVIHATWQKLLGAKDTFTPPNGSPALLLRELKNVNENPLAFLLDC